MSVTEVGDRIFGLNQFDPDLEALAEELDPTPNPYINDPVAWVEEELGEETWSKSREILASVEANRYTAVQACHDSGKSHTASRAMAWWLSTRPVGEAFVVSTAPTQTQVEAILWREAERAHRKGNLLGRITSGSVPMWKVGQEIVGYGRKPQDLTSNEEAAAAFSGIHARWVLIVIDEAGGVPQWLYNAVDTLATNEKARVLAIGNPDDGASHFAKVCSPGQGWNTIKIAASDTPNFTDEDVSESLKELLLSRTWVQERKTRWGVTSPLYTSKVLGEFPEVSDDTLLSPATLRACQQNELLGRARGQYGLDVARLGKDETVCYRDRGGVIRLEFAHHKKDTMETAGSMYNVLEPHKKRVPGVIDGDGLGAGVYDRLRELGMNVMEFRGAEKAWDPERFANRRAEVYWNFKTDAEAGEIDLPPEGEDDDLIAQLGAIKWKVDSKGRILIESKDDMAKRGMPSPDRADAAVYAHVRPSEWPKELTPDVRPKKQAQGLTDDLMTRKM